MTTNIQRLFLLIIGLLFCVLGCARDRAHVLIPDHISPPMEVHETVDVEVSFKQNILPILTSRCALAGCHVADGPDADSKKVSTFSRSWRFHVETWFSLRL